MKLIKQTPKQSLNKLFLKQRPLRDDINLFKSNLQILLGKINDIESEEHHKNFVRDFLLDTFYKSEYEINTKGRQDLVIHIGKNASDKVGVILEVKKPTNKTDMISADSPNKKALHELVLYFLRERIDENNIDIKYLIVTNINEWFIFDASAFNQLFFENKAFIKDYKDWRDKQKITSNTPLFYNEIVKPLIETIDREITCTYFNIRDYEIALKNDDLKDDETLIELFKILSPNHLLKVPFADDSNKLDKNFYTELLHIIGLEETKDKGKIKIDRKAKGNRDSGSLIENAIAIIETKDCLHKVKNLESYGAYREERLFGVALELCLTWINRILFLKLLEAQLVSYHKGNRKYKFLDTDTIPDFDELFTLFHQVLAKLPEDRHENIKDKYNLVPYLNSSLFEISELEDQTITIESLKDTIALPLINTTVLKDIKNQQGELPTLRYIFKFLDAYDFASEGSDGIKENNRSLINASVLGKVFEKINGYKDGSIYTPASITMYMCRQSIRLAVIQKFKDVYGWSISEFADLKNYLADYRSAEKIKEFNALINTLHLCDPAVGSGHFLVSSLNEVIAIKGELGVLADANGERFRDIEITIENDELTIFDTERSEFFKYEIQDGKPQTKEVQRLQKTLFYEKQNVIENCLFGVDVNPNSVKICRLRLWIELLKNAYYKEDTGYNELETLPNIDINIKEGNSLISRFALVEDLKEVLKAKKNIIEQYRNAVAEYKNERNRNKKQKLLQIIDEIKSDFRAEIYKHHPTVQDLLRKERRLYEINSPQLFDKYSEGEREALSNSLEKQISKLKQDIEEIKTNVIYKNAFEWRFEFPEVLDNQGNFIGFDIIIGNPPYIEARSSVIEEKIKDEILKNIGKRREKREASLITRGSDILIYFFELGLSIIKDTGYFSFITQNAWLDTDYGFKFQKFLKNNTQILGVFDDELKYFDDSANINTIITLFKGKSGNAENNINFVKFNAGFENAPLELRDFSESNGIGKVKQIRQDDSILNQIKWGIILNSDDLILDLHKRLIDKESKNLPVFRIGQGLNLTKDYAISTETVDKLKLPDDSLISYFTNDDGAPFSIKYTNNFLINETKLSLEEKELLEYEGFKAIKLNTSRREIPSLILPRGVGRFFCAINECNAYSTSFVEIYLEEDSNYSKNLLYLWIFLNSTIGWLIREISGRKNLGGGMLKAEAIDLKSYPIFFEFEDSLEKIKQIYDKLSTRQAETILSELNTKEHSEIDAIVFNKLGYSNIEGNKIKEKLFDLVSYRINKSKSKL